MILARDFLFSRQHGRPSMKTGVSRTKRESCNNKAWNSFSETDFLIHMWLHNPPGDAPECIERFLQLNLNYNSVFTELAKWIYSKSRWSSDLLKEIMLSYFTMTWWRSQVYSLIKNDVLHRHFCTILLLFIVSNSF